MESSDYISIIAIIANFAAVFAAGYLGIKYFTKQQKILRLEKHFYYDGILKTEEILLSESSKLDIIYNFVITKLDNFPLKVGEKNITSDEIEKSLIEMKAKLLELNSESLAFNPAINTTTDFIGGESGKRFLLSWINHYEENRKRYVIETNRLIDDVRRTNVENSDGSKDIELSNLMISHGKAITDTFYILWGINSLSIVFRQIKRELIDISISKQADISEVLSTDEVQGWISALEEMFGNQSKTYETDDALYPVRTLEHSIYLKKKPVNIKGRDGTFPTFTLEKMKEKVDFSNKTPRLFTYEELQSLTCACSEGDDINKRVNFVKDYLNTATTKLIKDV